MVPSSPGRVRPMNADQATRLALAFARETVRSATMRLSAVCVEVLGVSGAGITIMSGDQVGPLCVSGPNVAALEDEQFGSGRGPCRDAFRTGLPIHAPRLVTDPSAPWPTFAGLAQDCGFGAVFAYPLIAAGAKIGVLTLYQDSEGALSLAQCDDCVALCELLATTLLSLQDDAPRGTLTPVLDDAVEYRAVIHQASGMTAIQLGVSTEEALLRIRAHAFANDQTVAGAAALIVARILRLPDDRPTETMV